MRQRIAIQLTLGALTAVLASAGPARAGDAPPISLAEMVAVLENRGGSARGDLVHCLLPGRVQRLGHQATYLEPRRRILLAVPECEARGGEYTLRDLAALRCESCSAFDPSEEAAIQRAMGADTQVSASYVPRLPGIPLHAIPQALRKEAPGRAPRAPVVGARRAPGNLPGSG